MTTISVLGLGAMGSALAGALLKAGHSVTVWNRTPSKVQPLIELGARGAATAGEAVAASELVVVCLLDYASVEAVLGTVQLTGKIIVNLTNGTPEQARTMAARIEAQGAAYVDGGIMAVPPMIGEPDAFILYSGSQPAFERHKETLASLARPVFLGADAGLAPLNDIALLSAMYGLFAGFLHASALVRTGGGSLAEFMPLATAWLTAMTSTLPETARQVDSGRYAVEGGSNLAMQATGLANMVGAAREQGVDPLLIEPMLALMQRRVADGFGHEDVAGLIELLFLNGRGRATPSPTSADTAT